MKLLNSKNLQKKTIPSAIILTLILIIACKEKPIGGERDEHGCLGPAGYTWNQYIGACIREWELDENQKKAAKIVVAPLSYPVTIIGVDVARCPGCFVVHMQRNDNREEIKTTLSNWEIVLGEGLTPEQCTAQGGRTVNIVGGNTCSEDETTIGKVVGFILANICCVPKKGLFDCRDDSDCIPLPSDCHPMDCINKKFESNYEKPEVCTEIFMLEAAYKPEDCICYENKCTNINKLKELAYDQAIEIAEKSECTKKGELTYNYIYNAYTKTWWIDLEMKKEFKKDYCFPACVISEKTKTAEINWRCTGALPP